MAELHDITDRIVALRASLDGEMGRLELAERRLLRAQIEHCILDLQRVLAQLIAPSDAALDDGRSRLRDQKSNQIG